MRRQDDYINQLLGLLPAAIMYRLLLIVYKNTQLAKLGFSQINPSYSQLAVVFDIFL